MDVYCNDGAPYSRHDYKEQTISPSVSHLDVSLEAWVKKLNNTGSEFGITNGIAVHSFIPRSMSHEPYDRQSIRRPKSVSVTHKERETAQNLNAPRNQEKKSEDMTKMAKKINDMSLELKYLRGIVNDSVKHLKKHCGTKATTSNSKVDKKSHECQSNVITREPVTNIIPYGEVYSSHKRETRIQVEETNPMLKKDQDERAEGR